MSQCRQKRKVSRCHRSILLCMLLLVTFLLYSGTTDAFSGVSISLPRRSAGRSKVLSLPTTTFSSGRGNTLFYSNGKTNEHSELTASTTTEDPPAVMLVEEQASTLGEEVGHEIAVTAVPRKVQRHYETFEWCPRPIAELIKRGHQKHPHHDQVEGGVYKINYRVEGPVDGPPILLIHGFGANVGHFRHQFPALVEAGYRVYAIDLIGFGASDKPNIHYSIELFTEMLTDFVLAMDEQNCHQDMPVQPWVVAGNSIGGLCSLAVAEQLKERVRGVILFNCAGGMSVFRFEDLPKALRPILFFFKRVLLGPRLGRYFFSNFKSRENVESILKQQGVYQNATSIDEELLEMLLEPGNDEGAESVFLKVFGGPPGPTPESILPNLDCPVLALWGGADPWTPVDKGMHPGNQFHKYTKTEDLMELIVLPYVGHCPHDDAPEEVNRHMLRWMKDLPSPSPDGEGSH